MGRNNKEEKQKLNKEFEDNYNSNSLNQHIPSYDPKEENQNPKFLNNPPGYFPQHQQQNPSQYGNVYAQVSNVHQSQQEQLNSNDQNENLQQYGFSDFQNIIPPPVIFQTSMYKMDQEHVIPSVILFVAGFFFVIPWIRVARIFAICSVILFSIFVTLLVIMIIGLCVSMDD
ncbi:hypothetical protein ACTA71_009600 [Dictyostelium dimigraforme]